MSQMLQMARHPEVEGWLVLAGRMPSLGLDCPRLPELIMDNADLSWGSVCLTSGAENDPNLMGFLEDLDTLLDVQVETLELGSISAEEFDRALISGGLLFLVGGSAEFWLSAFDMAGVASQPNLILGQGRMLFAVGGPAEALGSWVRSAENDGFRAGLGWIPGAIILPDVESPAAENDVHELLKRRKTAFAIGLPRGAVFALGPGGEMEVWGGVPPVISLGAYWAKP